jgi:amino acid transporter
MTELRRSLSLPLVVLYGVGVTIGAGIYVLLGATAGQAGIHAPVSFAMAAIVMAFSAATFADLSTRMPVSAGEAAYVRAGFGSARLSLVVGCLVISSGVVSSAAITVGSIGYIREFLNLDTVVLVPLILLMMGGIAAWGIQQSVIFASLFTLVEAGALVAIIGLGVVDRPEIISEIPDVFPAVTDLSAWTAISGAALLAFFAFIGFEDIVNLAEEVEQPARTMPLAILLTLTIGTVLYFLVATVAVFSVPLEELAASEAPLSLVFGQITGASPIVITAIAIVATLNGVVIQIIMASRVVYGLGRQGSFPAVFARVHPKTQTPLVATGAVVLIVLVLAMVFPVDRLAEWTARIVLVIFSLVNGSLILLKVRKVPAPEGAFKAPFWVPVGGLLTCLALLAIDMATGL